jgi:hypothetical protein
MLYFLPFLFVFLPNPFLLFFKVIIYLIALHIAVIS